MFLFSSSPLLSHRVSLQMTPLISFLYNLCSVIQTSQQLQLYHAPVPLLSILQVGPCYAERCVTALASLSVFWHSDHECCTHWRSTVRSVCVWYVPEAPWVKPIVGVAPTRQQRSVSLCSSSQRGQRDMWGLCLKHWAIDTATHVMKWPWVVRLSGSVVHKGLFRCLKDKCKDVRHWMDVSSTLSACCHDFSTSVFVSLLYVPTLLHSVCFFLQPHVSVFPLWQIMSSWLCFPHAVKKELFVLT